MILNGPNLNFLGIREKEIYGNKTYQDLEKYLYEYSKTKNIELLIKQTNYEGELIDYIQKGYLEQYDGIIINPGALTHYSYSLYDAILSVKPLKVIEVHLTDPKLREDFRKKSVISEVCFKTIVGLGFESYKLAIDEFL
ncbi:MAG TPA: type II 3-dehydroquinate dehydratase [Bacilli bacterium]|jgi:3-dehydroquinate dehydratase-2|nr:type II 3-dehydroquinate dehydratase [Bacilli bacterium]